MLKIRNLHIHMFRIYKDNDFSFVTNDGEIAPMVLLVGGNGKGKTSIIDAIEWCFTGVVQHLNIPYELRCKNDRGVENYKRGLLRNKDCNNTEETWVEVTLEDNGMPSVIRRSTTKNEFSKESSFLSIKLQEEILNNETAENWLVQHFGTEDRLSDFFYKYFICDLQKAEDFRCKNRSGMTDEFKNFTIEHSAANQVVLNLEKLQDQLNHQIEDLRRNKVSQEIISQLEFEQKKCKMVAQIPAYGQRPCFDGENLAVDLLSPEQQELQLKLLIAGGYHTVVEWITEFVLSHRKLTLKKEFEEHRVEIQQVIKKKLYDLNTFQTLEDKQRKIYEQLKILNDKTLERVGNFLSETEEIKLTPDKWQAQWKEYCRLNDAWRKLEALFDDCQKGDELLTAFSRLVQARKQIDDYRQEYNKCPLCGAEEPFRSEPKDQLAREAEKYVKAHDEKKLALQEQASQEKKQWENYQNQLIADLRRLMENSIKILKDELNINKELKEKTELFFSQVAALKLNPEQFASLVTIEILDDFVGINEASIQKEERKIIDLLTFLGYPNSAMVVSSPTREMKIFVFLLKISRITLFSMN